MVRDGQEHPVHVYDLSLNGTLISIPTEVDLADDERFELRIDFGDAPSFTAEVQLAYRSDERLGLEFFNMDPENFHTLADLIERLRKAELAA